MRILVTDGMDKSAIATLCERGHEVIEQFYEPSELGEALKDVDVVVVRSKTKVRKEHIDAFRADLERYKINATLRREMGTDIMAACGQLRRGLEQ